jgi:hypothetical protein
VQAAAEAQKHLTKHPAAAAAEASSFKTPAPPKAATRLGGAEEAAAGAGTSKAAAGAAAGADSPSLTITVLDPVSTGEHCEQWAAGWACCCASRLRVTRAESVDLLGCNRRVAGVPWCSRVGVRTRLHAGGKAAAAAGKAPGGMMGPPASKTPAAFKTPAAAGQQPSSSEAQV